MTISQWVHDEIAHLKRLAEKWTDRAVTALGTLEADAKPLFQQIQAELTDEAYTIAKTELNAAMTAAMSGGGLAAIGGAIAATIPDLIAKLKMDGNAMAKNALYGIASVEMARITAAQGASQAGN